MSKEMREQIKNIIREYLNESVYKFNNLSSEEQKQIFDIFKKSYEESVGVSWSENKFRGRSHNWLFFGAMNGFIAVRPQKSGFYKLVGVAGNLKSILSGLNELQSQNKPVWGMVSSDLQKMALKKGFKTPPAFLLKLLFKFIPNSVFGSANFDINSDGSVTLKYSDVGDAKKYFIGNDEYFKKLKSDILPTLKDKLSSIPTIARKGIEMFLGENIDLDEARRNPETNVEQPIYKDILEFIDKHKGYEDLIFISFRNSIDVTFINKKNEHDTPTGLYTYPWKNYYKIKFHENIRGKLLPNIKETVPFAGDRKYMFLYKLKSNDGILTNESNYSETLSYAKKLLNTFPEEEITNLYINDYEKFVNKIYEKNEFTNHSLPEIHKFWILLHELASKKGSNIKYLFSSICRSIGINGFVDFGTGYIHQNERYQAVFLKGRPLFEDIKIIDLNRFKERTPTTLNKEYINKLVSNDIGYLLNKSKNPDELINKLISTKGFINKLDSDGISYLLQYSKNPDAIINKLISTKEYINKLDSNDIRSLLNKSKNPDAIINILGEKGKKFINNLDSDGIHSLLRFSKNPDAIINKLISTKGFINKLDSDGIFHLLQYSKNPDAIINKLISTKGFINKLESKGTGYLLKYSKNPDQVFNILGKKGKEFIYNLDSNGIYYLVLFSKNPDELKNTLLKNGVSKELFK